MDEFSASDSDEQSPYPYEVNRKGRDWPVAYFNDRDVRDWTVSLLNAAMALREDDDGGSSDPPRKADHE